MGQTYNNLLEKIFHLDINGFPLCTPVPSKIIKSPAFAVTVLILRFKFLLINSILSLFEPFF